MFIETIIGSPPKVKIMRTLLERRIAYSLKDIQELTGLSVGVIHKDIAAMLKEGVIIMKKGRGKQRFYQISPDNKYSNDLVMIFNDEKIERRGIPIHIWSRLETLCSNLKSKFHDINNIILFGSLARGEIRIDSDIDILVITEEEFKDEVGVRVLCKKNGMKNKISPIFITNEEFERHNLNKSDFYCSILKEGLRLV